MFSWYNLTEENSASVFFFFANFEKAFGKTIINKNNLKRTGSQTYPYKFTYTQIFPGLR